MFIDNEIQEYAEVHSGPASKLLQQLERETHVNVVNPNMLSGSYQGMFLEMISKMIRPRYILEIGTYTGYSAICFEKGLQKNGRIITIDSNEEISHVAKKYFRKAGIEDKIDFRIGDALEIIPELDMQFDLVFIDGSKNQYTQYLELILDKVRPGGYILADNVLWGGNVLEEKTDKDTADIKKFNQMVRKNKKLEKVMLPIRDGLYLIRKTNNE
jgi:predicted O-methyltransferase YrrM